MSPDGAVRLVDERSEVTLRRRIGALLERCQTADLALARVRLGALDLTYPEVRGPGRVRVLLGQLDAAALLDVAPQRPDSGARRGPASGPDLEPLREWLRGGRLEVRSAGIGAWTPDFSVFALPDEPATSLLGAHYFGSPQLTVGPSVTAIIQGRDAELLRARFEELWDRGHDVAPAILQVLERARDGAGRDS
jgi:hypothetical protein